MCDLTEYLNEYNMKTGDLEALERRLDAEWEGGDPQSHQTPMIEFLDRLEEDVDLFGVEWAIVHGLESLDGHNEAVIRNWKPSYWRKLLIRRIANSGVMRIAGNDIRDYL